MRNYYIWTEEELSFLKDNYERMGIEYCMKKLGRSINGIKRILCLRKISPRKIKLQYTENVLRQVISISSSVSQVLSNLKIRVGGGNFNTIKKYIKLYKIDTSHFLTSKQRGDSRKGKSTSKKNINELLIENAPYLMNGNIKKRLYDEGIKERACEKCGQGEFWQGNKMSLILDHKNGICNDYRLENLQIVCPNCNATLATHCRGNKVIKRKKEKQIRLKKILNKETEKHKIERKIKNIFRENKQKVIRPSYEQLLQDVEETNYCAVGRKYGVSDNCIRIWIRRYKRLAWLQNKLLEL